MDEERFNSLLMDELYGELDDEASASVRRFAAANPAAAAQLARFSQVRQAASPELLPIPADLEDRILEATRKARAAAPKQSRLAVVVSRAGAWAMRPQTAMAAVFLLMIGSSLLLVRGGRNKAPASTAMTVTEEGAPSAPGPGAATDEHEETPDPRAAALAHGALAVPRARPAAPAGESEPSAAPADLAGQAVAGMEKEKGAERGVGTGADRVTAELSGGGGSGSAVEDFGGLGRPGRAGGGAVALEAPEKNADPAGRNWAPAPPAPGQTVVRKMAKGDSANEGVYPSGAGAAEPLSPQATQAPQVAAIAAPAARPATKAATAPKPVPQDFDSSLAAYRAHDFATAAAGFDALATSGDMNAALWAARSVREQRGCSAAVARLDGVAARAADTVAGHDATFESAVCHKAMGATDAARARFNSLLSVPSHASRAAAQIETLDAKNASTSKSAPKAAPSKPVDTMKQKSAF